jgi:hypothetical protein
MIKSTNEGFPPILNSFLSLKCSSLKSVIQEPQPPSGESTTNTDKGPPT